MSKTCVDWDSYDVSPCGIVYSKPRQDSIPNRWGGISIRTFNGRSLKPWEDSSGRYLYVNLGSKLRISVHRMVAMRYLPNPNLLTCVHHKGHNPKNNCVSNLEWVSHSSNMQYNASDGRCSGFYGKQKLVPSGALDEAMLSEYGRCGSFSAMDGFMGASRTAISRYFKKRNLNV